MSLKRLSPNWWVRIKNGKKVGIGIFLTIIALSKFIIPAIGSTGIVVTLTYYIFAGLISIFMGLLAAYLRGRMKLIPDSLLGEIGLDGQYICKFCSVEKFREACEMTKPYYRDEYVPADIAEQWRMKNKGAFVQITNSNGELCSSFGILALSKSFMDQYIKGNVADTQLREDDILNMEDSKKCDRLYISGVIVRDPSKHVGHKRTCVMLWAMMVYVKSIYGLKRKREIFAVAVTEESERLMKKLGFQVICESAQRKDKRNMYRIDLTKNTWNKLMNKVGDYSRMCTCEFNPKNTVEAPQEK